jgi:hypothetical protein
MRKKNLAMTESVDRKNILAIQSSFNEDVLKPFEEKEDVPNEEEDGGRPCAHDLFSMFTADIIRQQTLFTR